MRRGDGKKPLSPCPIRVGRREHAPAGGCGDVPERPLDRRFPRAGLGPEEEMVLPEAPEAGHLGAEKGQVLERHTLAEDIRNGRGQPPAVPEGQGVGRVVLGAPGL